jgi:hypothetical protein
MTTTLLDEMDLMLDNKPVHVDGPVGRVVDGYYVVDIYRGSDTTNVEGISWWTTQYSTACIYADAHGDKGFIMHRTIQLPVMKGHICSPNDYLLGGRKATREMFNTVDSTDLTHYYYGLCYGDISLHSVPHFDISIHHTLLEGLTIEGSI